jgi:hypothetical protein
LSIKTTHLAAYLNDEKKTVCRQWRNQLSSFSFFNSQPVSMMEKKNSLQAMKKTDHAGNGKNSLQTTHLSSIG